MKKILITGGIGSGKSYICRLFENENIPVFYYDDESKKILENIELHDEIKNILEIDIITNNKIDKGKIANIIFNDDKKREQLENLFKPHLMHSFYEQCYEYEYKKHKSLFIAESAILLKSNSYKMFDEVIYVDADISKRKEMVMKNRSNISSEDFDNRFNKQLSTVESILILEKNNIPYTIFQNDYDDYLSLDFVKNAICNSI